MNPIHPIKIFTLLALSVSNSHGATAFTHSSGDDIIAAGATGLTGTSFSQVIDADTKNLDPTYAGTHPTRASTDGFYNSDISAVPSNTRFETAFTSTGGNITVVAGESSLTTGFNYYEVTTGAGVSEVVVDFSYLGQFHAGKVYNSGFTGRWSRLNPPSAPINERGMTIRNLGAEVLEFQIEATDFGGSASTLAASGFYDGPFQKVVQNYGTEGATSAATTPSGYGTGAVNADFGNNRGLFFHNGSNLGSTLESVKFTIKDEGGSGTIATGATFRFTFDVMTHEDATTVVPEPSSILFFAFSGVCLIGKRRRR